MVVRGYTPHYPPFLSIMTRHYVAGRRRSYFLERNKESVQALVDPDVEQIIMVDHTGHGIQWANSLFGRFKNVPAGQYIFILDDDDQFIDTRVVNDLKRIVAEENSPDIIRVKMQHLKGDGGYHVWPSEKYWGTTKIARVGDKGGFSSFIVRAEVWRAHIDVAGRGLWGGDYRFLKSVYAEGNLYTTYWWDKIISRTNAIGGGG